jgi:hypothetical protein
MSAKNELVGVGLSQKVDSLEAGKEAGQIALKQLSDDASNAWAIAFCGGRHDPDGTLKGFRSELGDIEILGGAAIGTITNTSLSYTGYECAVAVFPSSIPKPAIIKVEDLNESESKAGRRLGSILNSMANEGDDVLLFYDSIRSSPPPVLNTGSLLLDGIYDGLAGKKLNLIGAGLVGDFEMSQSYVFDGEQSMKHIAVAAILPSVLSCHTAIMHGCTPVSSFLEITRVEGPVIYEIDGRPALDVLKEMVGNGDGGPSQSDNLSMTVTLGEKHGDLYAPYDESAYVNRLIVGTNPEEGSVTLFEADFQIGTKVQIMARNHEMTLESVEKRTLELIHSLGAIRPVLGFYVDCAGRACAFSGGTVEEASVLQSGLGKEIPLLGFYSGVELAPFINRSRPLDWTGVLTLFTVG